MALPTVLVTPVGTITLGVPLASISVLHNGHSHIFTSATVVAMFPYDDTEVRYEIRTAAWIVGVLAAEVTAFSVI